MSDRVSQMRDLQDQLNFVIDAICEKLSSEQVKPKEFEKPLNLIDTQEEENDDQAEIIRCFEYMAEIGQNVPSSLAAGAHSAMATLERLVPDYPFKGKAKKARAAQAITKLIAKGTLVEHKYRDNNRHYKSRLMLSDCYKETLDFGELK